MDNNNNDVMNDMRELLSLSCKLMKKKLDDGKATAADIQAIRGLLKDNGITVLNVPGSPTNELANAVTEKIEAGGFPFAVSGDILAEDDPAVANSAVRAHA